MRKGLLSGLFIAKFFCSIAVTNAQTAGDAIIYPDVHGELIDAFFYDLKQSPEAVNDYQQASTLFVEDGMNGVRIPVYGEPKRPAHPSAGVVDGSQKV